MNKWIGIVGLVILVVAVGLFFSKEQPPSEESASADSAMDATGDAATAGESTADSAASCPTPSQAGSGANQAGLLVTFGDGTSQSICVSFDGDSISGYQLLMDSGLDIVTEDYGPGNGQALCKITSGSESDGCDYPNEGCFCDNPPNFWAFFVTENQQDWLESQKGLSNAYVSDGGAQAQSWGDGKTLPPSCFYSDICG